MDFSFAQHLSFEETVNAEENPVIYLAIDPGKSNGVCGYDAKMYPVFMLTVNIDDIDKFISLFRCIKTCVIEKFILFPHKARQQIYSDMGTSRVIGRVENWCNTANIELVQQLPAIKPTAYKWINQKPPTKSNPRNHELDAHAHFMYWAIKKGLIVPSIKRKNESLSDIQE